MTWIPRKILKVEKNNAKVLIVDFYNLYCDYTQFHKHKFFSKESFIYCVDSIAKCLKNHLLIFISKEIYEVSIKNITNIIRKYNNIYCYCIVEDLYISNKSKNRERDDLVCILFHYILKNEKYHVDILSNDKYRNYLSIIKKSKPIRINFIYQNNFYYINCDNLENMKTILENYRQNISRVGFSYIF